MKIEDFRSKIADLIQKYERAKQSGLVKKYSEEETKKDFILVLNKKPGYNYPGLRCLFKTFKLLYDIINY